MKYLLPFLFLIVSCKKEVVDAVNPTPSTSTIQKSDNFISDIVDIKTYNFTVDNKVYPDVYKIKSLRGFSSAIQSAEAGTIVYDANGVSHVVVTFNTEANNYVSPIHFINKDGSWIIEGGNYGQLMDGVRNYTFLDNKGTVAFANYGGEVNQGNLNTGNVYLMKTNSDNSLAWQLLTGSNKGRYHNIASGDINMDGIPDILTGSLGVEAGSYPGENGLTTILSKNGSYEITSGLIPNDSEMAKAQGLNNSIGYGAVGVVDLDKDGIPELIKGEYGGFDNPKDVNFLFVCSYNASTKKYSDIKVLPKGVFSSDNTQGITSMQYGDINWDGNMDVVVASEGHANNTETTTLQVWYGDGKKNLTPGEVYQNDSQHLFREFELGKVQNTEKVNMIFMHPQGCPKNNDGIDLNRFILFNDGSKLTNATNAFLPFTAFANTSDGIEAPWTNLKGFFLGGKLRLIGFFGSTKDNNSFKLFDITFKNLK